MAIAKDLIKGFVKKIFLRDAIVTHVNAATPNFRWLTLQGDGLKGVACNPGDKLQVGVRGLVMRAYTPLNWDPATGTTQLLVFTHGDGPGAKWAKGVREGDTVQVFGPRGSLDLKAAPGPLVFVGDETAFACARNLHDAHAHARNIRFVFEVANRDESTPILTQLGLHDAIMVEKLPQLGHLCEMRAAAMTAARTVQAKRVLCVGSGAAGQALRGALRQEASFTVKVKAYWVAGKAGLD